jgi:uncharacterized protein (UPF0332 family)
MMQPDNILLAKYSLEKSDKALKTAEETSEIDYQTSLNRAYYSIFYLVLALGYVDGFKTGKHSQLMGWFNKKYIYQEKIFEPKYSEIYSQLMINRDKFDYDVSSEPNYNNAIEGIDKAKIFIDNVKPYVLNRIEREKKES